MSTPAATEITLEGFAPPTEAGRYRHLPFEVPPGVGRLEVRYQYSAAIGSDPHLTGGNTVDIGLFDQRGIDFPGGGFRGWSGSARSAFFVSPTEATPGYLPGPLEPGTWHNSLGFYKIAPEGCHYRVDLRLLPESGPARPTAFPPMLTLSSAQTRLPERPDGWYRGELHCHSCHSDGDSTPGELIAEAEALGLDFLAITDHNTISHLADPAQRGPHPLTLIPGCEVTTYKGHWNVWGQEGWLEFRMMTPERMEQTIRHAVQQGCLTSCNHPRPYGPPWELEEVMGYHCVEVWNGPWMLFNQAALDFWEARLRQGRRLVAVGGSDAHRLQEEHIARIGTPTTWIYCPGRPTAAGLLAGLRAGHAFISAGPQGPQLYLRAGRAMMGDSLARPPGGELDVTVRVVHGQGLALELRDAEGCLHSQTVQAEEQTFTASLPVRGTPYVRAQLVEPGTAPPPVRALTNPIYFA